MIIEIVLAGIGIVLSAFFSGSEIAVISAHPLQLQKWASQKKAFAQSALNIYEDRQHYLTVILVGNTLANVLTTTFATLFLTNHLEFDSWQVILIISGVVLLFGEVLPKSLIRSKPNSFLLFSTAVMKVPGIFLNPIARFFEKIISGLLRLFKSDAEPMNIMIRREEIEQSITESYNMGILNEKKKKYIDNLFDFSDTTASEIITPRIDIFAVSETASISQLKKAFIKSGFSKIIVYRDNIDEILGYVSLRDVLNGAKNISSILRPIKFYPESKSIIELLKEFQDSKTSIAIIVDEFGVSSGLITMEDIVEEIFGEFDDEFDENADQVRRHTNGDLLVNGRTEIDYLNDEYNLEIPEGEYETIAGYLLDRLDRFPTNGEVFNFRNVEFTILRATAKSIDYLKIRYMPVSK